MRDVNLSVDPGLSLGWAIWKCSEWKQKRPPWKTGSVNPPSRKLSWIDRAMGSLRKFESTIEAHLYKGLRSECRLRAVYIEWPDFEAGDTAKLVFTVGWLARWAALEQDAHVELIGVNEWKGQLKKPQTDARIRELLGPRSLLFLNNHARDAVGVGLHCKGFEFG